MNISNPCLVYSIWTVVFECMVVTIMYLCNISPISSNQIMLFLQIFIPLIMLESYIVLRVIAYKAKTKRDDNSEVVLVGFSLAAFLGGTICCHIIIILFGAPLIETVEESFVFACLCCSLTISPLFIVYEGRWEEFVNYLPEPLNVRDSLHDTIKMISTSTLVGAWLGAFPIPLDWDRDWQAWPITCCVGAICGHVVGLTYVILSCVGIISIGKQDWKNKIT